MYKRLFYLITCVLVLGFASGVAPGDVLINEMMASNSTAIADEHGEFDDWIEIYNSGPSAVLMSGMFLEDDDGFRWEIPPGISINSGEYLLFWADDGSPTEGNLHTNFKLGASGDGVTLYDTDGITVIDTKSFSGMDTDISYGRYPDATDNWYDMADSTPGAANAMGMSGEVYFSRPAGLFKGSFSLGLTTESGGVPIRYTTNGSEPTASIGQDYTGLITVSNTAIIRAAAFQDGYARGPVETNSYISLDDVYSQPDQPAGFPDAWHDRADDQWDAIKAVDYGMDPVVIANYAAQLDDAFTSIPTMSIVMDMDDLFSRGSGIYPNSYGSDQKPASVELIHSDGTDGFEINCNIRNHGAGSRDISENLKHSFRLLFNGENGAATKLNYPLFEGSPVTQFDTLVLRGGNNFTWNNHGHGGGDGDQRMTSQCIRDIWGKDTQLALGRPASRGAYVHLYLNGLYWGLYNPIERPNAPFLADHLGGEREDWDSINGSEGWDPDNPDPDHHAAKVVDGDSDAWYAMMAIADGGLSSQSAYDDIQEYLDVENLIDYVIVQHYTQNTDWEESNWYVGRRRLPVAGYKFFIWDVEYSFFDVNRNMVTEDWPFSPRRLYNKLRDNEEFRLLFADHLHRHFFNGGPMTTEPCRQRWMRRANEIDTAIIAESARWGDAETNYIRSNINDYPKNGGSYTRDGDWITARDSIVNDFMGARSGILLGQYKGIGLYPSIDAPVFSQHGGYISVPYTLTITNPNGSGTIYYTTDGSDPRLQGGAVSSSASSSLPYTLNDTKQIKARVLNNGEWSALNEAVFADDSVADSIRITEIMYHPTDPTSAEIAAVNPDPTDEAFEFIEVKNISGTALDLNLVHFTDGIDFTFGDYTLAAGALAIIVKNQDAFAARYPGVSPSLIAGTYTGAINNGGERIELVDALGETILNFRFKDGWYPITDGDAFSLNIIDPTNTDLKSWEYAQYWQPSTVAGGTPSDGDTGHVALPGDIVISEIMAHTNSSPNDWIELHNTSGSPINIAGWFLSDDDNNFKKYEIQAGDSRASIPAGGYVVFTQDDDFGDAADPGSNVQFGYSELGETAYVCSGSSGELAGGFCTKEDFKASEGGVSFGRYTKSASAGYDVDFIPMTAPTYDTANTGSSPRVGPVVISEIMYHPGTANPLNSYAEYVELYNASGSPVALYDTSNTWMFTDEDNGITLDLPTGITIPAGGLVLLVKNLEAFTAEHGTPSVPAYEWLEGRLSNAGDKINLMKPGEPEPDGSVAYYRIDRVNYSDGYHHENFRELPSDPWPTSPDGGGDALHRSRLTSYGNDVDNWTAGTPTPGFGQVGQSPVS
ncbi:lamin tail domain-containing protein, partial [Candidatus Sumerlaeota bacterium]